MIYLSFIHTWNILRNFRFLEIFDFQRVYNWTTNDFFYLKCHEILFLFSFFPRVISWSQRNFVESIILFNNFRNLSIIFSSKILVSNKKLFCGAHRISFSDWSLYGITREFVIWNILFFLFLWQFTEKSKILSR